MGTSADETFPVDAENARVGYQVAVDLASSNGETIWSMFNAMIVANSIVVAGITFVLTNQQPLLIFRVLLPIVGLVLCIAWLLQVTRAYGYVTYYLLSARELEEHYLSQQVQTISRGGDFADRKAVSLEIGGARITRRMKLLPRLIRGEWTSYVVIFVFIVVYIGSFFQV